MAFLFVYMTLLLSISHANSIKNMVSDIDWIGHSASYRRGDSIMSNLLEDIEEFYSHRFKNELRFGNKLFLNRSRFSPNTLDFGTHPIGHPITAEVTLSNGSPDHLLEILAISSNHEGFLCSKFNVSSIKGSGSVKFNVTFAPARPGLMEATVFVATDAGILHFQVFGSGYLDEESLTPVVHLLNIDDSEMTAYIEIFNPHLCSAGVKELALFMEAQSVHDPHVTLHGSIINKYIYPRKMTELITLPITKTELSKHRFLLLSFSFDTKCSNSMISQDPTSHSSDTLVITLTEPKNEAKMMSSVNVIHFGIVTSAHGSINRSLDIISLSRRTINFAHVFTDTPDPSISIQLTNSALVPYKSKPQTIATISLSASNITHTHTLSGYIIAMTTDQKTLHVPYYARLIHGSTLMESTNTTHTDFGIIYKYFLTNKNDVPLKVLQPRLPQHLLDRLVLQNGILGSVVLLPNQQTLVIECSVRYSLRSHIQAVIPVVTNASICELEVDAHSGLLYFDFPTARLVAGVFDFGQVPIGQMHMTHLHVHNKNPFRLAISSFLLTVLHSEAETVSLADIASISPCSSTCSLSPWNKVCYACVNEIGKNTTFQLPVDLRSFHQNEEVTGYVILRSTHQHFLRRFRFVTVQNELTTLPQSLQITGLFPGKRIDRNLILKYASRHESIQLTGLSMCGPYHSVPASIRLTCARDKSTENNSAVFSARLPPGKPTLVASVLVDPSLDCCDILACANQSTESPICYTGFALESHAGSLLGFQTNHFVFRKNQFQDGLLRTAQLYTRLYALWLRQQENLQLTNVNRTARYAIGLQLDQKVPKLWTDLSLSYIWPYLARTSPQAKASKSSSSQCTLSLDLTLAGASNGSSSRPLIGRANFPVTNWAKPIDCDLVISNPSDYPLFVQPLLLDSVYNLDENRSRGQLHDPMTAFFHELGLPASPDPLSKLAKLIIGTFSLKLLESHGRSLVEPIKESLPCCPSFILPPRYGRANLRVTFTPNLTGDDLFTMLENTTSGSVTSHNLLFIRNNLTALEPIWLNVHRGTVSMSLGLSTYSSSNSQANRTDSSTTINVLLVRHQWIQSHSNNTPEQPITGWVSKPFSSSLIDYDMESVLRKLTGHVEPSRTKSYNDELDDQPRFEQAVHELLIKYEDPRKLFFAERALILSNTGAVPITIYRLFVGPDNKISNPNLFFSSLSKKDIASFMNEYKNVACQFNGFRLTPCMPPRNLLSHIAPLTMQPGDHLRLNVGYQPDFVKTRQSANLWIVASPQLDNEIGWESCMDQSKLNSSHQCAVLNDLLTISMLRIRATFPFNILRMCLDALPRPWFERVLWYPFAILTVASILIGSFVALMDGTQVAAVYQLRRQQIDSHPFNLLPVPSRVLNLSREYNPTGCNEDGDDMKYSSDEELERMIHGVPGYIIIYDKLTAILTSVYQGITFCVRIFGSLYDRVCVCFKIFSVTYPSSLSPSLSRQPPVNNHVKKCTTVLTNGGANGVEVHRLSSINNCASITPGQASVDDLKTTRSRVNGGSNVVHAVVDSRMSDPVSNKHARIRKKSKVDKAECEFKPPPHLPALSEHSTPDTLHHLVTTSPTSRVRTKSTVKAPQTEAQIAAAIRASVRLSEETGAQGRKKLSTQVKPTLVVRDKTSTSFSSFASATNSTPDKRHLNKPFKPIVDFKTVRKRHVLSNVYQNVINPTAIDSAPTSDPVDYHTEDLNSPTGFRHTFGYDRRAWKQDVLSVPDSPPIIVLNRSWDDAIVSPNQDQDTWSDAGFSEPYSPDEEMERLAHQTQTFAVSLLQEDSYDHYDRHTNICTEANDNSFTMELQPIAPSEEFLAALWAKHEMDEPSDSSWMIDAEVQTVQTDEEMSSGEFDNPMDLLTLLSSPFRSTADASSFYELPQIVESKFVSMLKYENGDKSGLSPSVIELSSFNQSDEPCTVLAPLTRSPTSSSTSDDTYRAWQAVLNMPTEDLISDLRLDEFSEVMTFDLSFSYHDPELSPSCHQPTNLLGLGPSGLTVEDCENLEGSQKVEKS